jgi:3-hydroxybutyryl-CoA dehydrogenase
MPETNFANAGVIGTGMMGPGIALTLAWGGVRATMLSRTDEGAASGVAKAQALAKQLVEDELASETQAERAIGLMAGSSDFDGVVRASDLIVESGPEDLAWKRGLFTRLTGLAPRHAVLASNTSGLSITEIAASCAWPERILATHFWNPPHLMPLVEIVKGEKTSQEAASAVRDLLAACGKTPVIVKKDRPGQLGNRLQMALVREAAYIVAEGIADADDVDTVARNGFGLRMPAYGILEHQDMVGLDLGISVLEHVVRDLYNEPRPPKYYCDLVRRGDLGVKAGYGFYDWSLKSADEVKTRRDQFLALVLRERRRLNEISKS